MELIIKKLSPSGKSGFAVVTKKIGFATIDVAAGYIKVDEGTQVGAKMELPANLNIRVEERTTDVGICSWLRMD